jgi:uncharacterized alpha-E superfamily protein
MLSRTADHLYWMGRYIERAENLARMLEVNQSMALLPQSQEAVEQAWIATLTITGMKEPYQKRQLPVRPYEVLSFIVLDRDNPGSIYNCIRAARENARAVRGALTSEIWETINASWLEMRATGERQLAELDTAVLFEWVKQRAHLARGVIHGTMLRDLAWHFTWLGTTLERADSTARILDVKYHLLLPRGEQAGGLTDYYQWSALLNSVSAFEIYRRVYRDLITPRRVAELLILREDMPRSLHYCISQAHRHLTAVGNHKSAETLRRAGELQASLHYGRIEDIITLGMHEYLTRFIGRVRDLGECVAQDFLVSGTGD